MMMCRQGQTLTSRAGAGGWGETTWRWTTGVGRPLGRASVPVPSRMSARRRILAVTVTPGYWRQTCSTRASCATRMTCPSWNWGSGTRGHWGTAAGDSTSSARSHAMGTVSTVCCCYFFISLTGLHLQSVLSIKCIIYLLLWNIFVPPRIRRE